jgi:hypothetical protein
MMTSWIVASRSPHWQSMAQALFSDQSIPRIVAFNRDESFGKKHKAGACASGLG